MTSHPHDPAHHLARLEADRVFVQRMIVDYCRKLARIEEALAEWANEAGDRAEVRDLAGGAVRVIKEEA